MPTFILVPGAWFGGWIWQPVVDPLRARGHDPRPVTLAGLGDRAAESRPEIDLATHAIDVAAAIREAPAEDVVLVAHSYGSAVVPGALREAGQRVARVIYVDTGPLAPDMAVTDFEGPDGAERLRRQVDTEGDGWQLPPPDFGSLPASTIDGLTADQLRAMNQHATPQPFATYTAHVGEAPPHAASLVAANDARHLLSLGLPQLAFMASFPRRDVPGGHWPMQAHPTELADALVELADARG
jgi:pimeloyl-ACP methyl ester carboxylesterase